jgi:predicted nucleic acid-binding protein
MTALKIVVDSWAWVEILKLSRAGRAAKEQIVGADEAFTPGSVLAELARKYLREGVDPALLKTWLQGISEATEVYGIDSGLAFKSAEASAELVAKARKENLSRPGLGDALVLATARAAQGQVLTGDLHFRGLRETLWLGDELAPRAPPPGNKTRRQSRRHPSESQRSLHSA